MRCSLAAIQFVLGDLTGGQLRADERKSMLHEGGGAHVMSAYVEIYFDNSTGRFPTEKDEVRARPGGSGGEGGGGRVRVARRCGRMVAAREPQPPPAAACLLPA